MPLAFCSIRLQLPALPLRADPPEACPAGYCSLFSQYPALPHPTNGHTDLAMDVLVPKPPRKPTAFKFSFPWELKSEKAVWRGTRWCDEGLPQHVVSGAAPLLSTCMSWMAGRLSQDMHLGQRWCDRDRGVAPYSMACPLPQTQLRAARCIRRHGCASDATTAACICMVSSMSRMWPCNMTPQVGCSRYHMGDLYNKSEEARKLLDFGFSKGKAANAPPLSTQDFAR